MADTELLLDPLFIDHCECDVHDLAKAQAGEPTALHPDLARWLRTPAIAPLWRTWLVMKKIDHDEQCRRWKAETVLANGDPQVLADYANWRRSSTRYVSSLRQRLAEANVLSKLQSLETQYASAHRLLSQLPSEVTVDEVVEAVLEMLIEDE